MKKIRSTKKSDLKSAKKTTRLRAKPKSLEKDDNIDFFLEWPALESNPDALTKYIHGIGVPKRFAVYDVLGLEKELLALVPGTIHALIFLFPAVTESGDCLMASASRRSLPVPSSAPFFMWQNEELGNACGAIALIHALANSEKSIPLRSGSKLDKFLSSSRSKTPAMRGAALACCVDLMNAQADCARDEDVNQTKNVEESNDEESGSSNNNAADYHFTCFIPHEGFVYELDGCRNAPRKLGKLSVNVNASAKEHGLAFAMKGGEMIKKEFLSRVPEEEARFAILALAGKK